MRFKCGNVFCYDKSIVSFDGGILKAFRCISSPERRRNLSPIAIGIIIILFLPTFILAEDQPTEIEKGHAAGADQIQIVADKLITNPVEKYAEFSGDVKTTHPDFVMVSDTLRIYYKDNLPGLNKGQTGSQELIKRIVARGNVTITSEKYTAKTQSAEYDPETMIMVLEGENSTVQSGKNILTGSKITIYRKDEKIAVEGSPQQRVKAVFYSNKNAEKQP
jgi:lipopolysaccharide transport protein LptA